MILLATNQKTKPVKTNLKTWYQIGTLSFSWLFEPEIFGNWSNLFKGSPDPNHFIFDINVGKVRLRLRTTLNLNDNIFNQFWIHLEIHHSISASIRIFPTLISKIKWLWYELPLTLGLKNPEFTWDF